MRVVETYESSLARRLPFTCMTLRPPFTPQPAENNVRELLCHRTIRRTDKFDREQPRNNRVVHGERDEPEHHRVRVASPENTGPLPRHDVFAQKAEERNAVRGARLRQVVPLD